ncbi:hypothetical protein ACWCQZ_47175 [Streptomyces sp. NPDC002285]
MTYSRDESEYGPHSPDYGLSYDPDPFADPEPIDDPDAWESDFREQDPSDDHLEADWEQALREGHITREQFAQRRRIREPGTPQAEPPDPGPVIRSAVDKLRAKLASPDLSDDERATEQRTLASLEQMLKKGE